jgi:hypothetical protein
MDNRGIGTNMQMLELLLLCKKISSAIPEIVKLQIILYHFILEKKIVIELF